MYQKFCFIRHRVTYTVIDLQVTMFKLNKLFKRQKVLDRRRPGEMFLVSDKYKYVIICYPKSGCTVLRLLHLYMNHAECAKIPETVRGDFEWAHHHIQEDALPARVNSFWYVVQVFRNPYERALSTFFQKWLAINSGENDVVQHPRCKTATTSFSEFLEAYNAVEDIHFCPQRKHPRAQEFVDLSDVSTQLFKNSRPELYAKMSKIYSTIDNRNRLPRSDKRLPHDFLNHRYTVADVQVAPQYVGLDQATKQLIRQKINDDFYEENINEGMCCKKAA